MVQMNVRTFAITTAVAVSLSAALIARAAGPFKGHADAAQFVTAGEFAEFVAALRAEAAYGNLHTDQSPGGEIRGQVVFHRSDSINDD